MSNTVLILIGWQILMYVCWLYRPRMLRIDPQTPGAKRVGLTLAAALYLILTPVLIFLVGVMMYGFANGLAKGLARW